MADTAQFNTTLASPVYHGEADVTVGREGLAFRTGGGALLLDFSLVDDCRLLDYRVMLDTPAGVYELSRLGQQTEAFFEKLWAAYAARSRESLFIEGAAALEVEGEYAYTDDGGSAKGKAKLDLRPLCVSIVPHNSGARRIPLCFVRELRLDDYAITIVLDTGERYELARLGHDTLPFYEMLSKFRDETQRLWTRQHTALLGALDSRLGDAAGNYRFLKNARGEANMATGLFAADSEDFWFVSFGEGRAAVELVLEEKAATYLYRFALDRAVFETRLRHAMEAMGPHREIIFMEDAALQANPLYVMALRRNAHLRFLRASMSGRAVHTGGWNAKVAAFFNDA